jgi:arginase
VDICLIQVPYMAGDGQHGSADGPRRLLKAGLAERLGSKGIAVAVERVEREGPFRDTASSTASVNKRLAATVSEAVAAGKLPLVLAGSCVACMGVLGGFDHSCCGVVWIDAHADFNTPDSTASGFFPGMSAAVITGHCYQSYWGTIGDATPIAESAVAMVGVRDLWPEAERERLARSAIHVVEWRDGKPDGEIGSALDDISRRVDEVYLHLDLDALDPEIAPGIVDDPVPGGLSLQDAEDVVRAVSERFRIRATTLATFTPDRDRGGKTLQSALRMLELVGEYAGRDSGACAT